MQSSDPRTVHDPQGPARPPPSPTREDPPDASALRAELDRLNERLQVLESASLAARAYIEAWIAFVATGVAGKLYVDALRDPLAEGVPWHVLPFVLLALLVLGDVVRLRRRLHRVRADESVALARQRELRTRLGLDEIRLPLDDLQA